MDNYVLASGFAPEIILYLDRYSVILSNVFLHKYIAQVYWFQIDKHL